MTAATLLVLLIIVVELYRPIIIGDAIDHYINGYYKPYTEVSPGCGGKCGAGGRLLSDSAVRGQILYGGTAGCGRMPGTADGRQCFAGILCGAGGGFAFQRGHERTAPV